MLSVAGVRPSVGDGGGYGARAHDAAEAPYVVLVRRADHLITSVTVTCDTRNPDKRREELKETLREMIRQAGRSKTISLGVGTEIIGDLTEKMLDKVIEPDIGPIPARPSSS